MARSGGQPTAALAITCTSFPVRRGVIMTRRSCCVHNPKNPSCFHRLRISFFFSSSRSSFPCHKVVVSYKSGRICAQLPFSVPQFNLCRSLCSLLPTSFVVFASRSYFFRRLALRFHAFEWQFATSPAESALSYHFPLHDSIFADLSTLYFRQSFIAFASRSISRRLSPITASFRRPSSIGTSMTSRVLSEALKSSFVRQFFF